MGRSVATTSEEMPIIAATSAAASTSFHLGDRVLADRRDGEEERRDHEVPIASPAHHTDQAPRNSLPSITPEASNVVAPIVALISMLAGAARSTIARRRGAGRAGGGTPPTEQGGGRQGASVFPAAVVAAANGVARSSG